ncbi:hypothetical protein [Paraburkholderia humisilvae]|uniref:Uncharacterized protein n=1 Tax=Paraburkholderia humisilvae TaxID=627669 RepID=A0A6J5DG71_9BURK|nr:hypothetical protein [Paraburkholderia humisilvae]CAB3752434.1 hypothetical protein LMG29542_01747 [Paraburkholderia humisilvae]
MKFLESPDLGDPKEVWVEWLSQLKAMNRRDESVKFAIRRAETVIAELESLSVA